MKRKTKKKENPFARLPKQIFAKVENVGGGDEFISAAKTIKELDLGDEFETVGVYVLKATTLARTGIETK